MVSAASSGEEICEKMDERYCWSLARASNSKIEENSSMSEIVIFGQNSGFVHDRRTKCTGR